MSVPPSARLLVISPVKDEAAYLHRTIAAMAAQTRRPDRWVIVDDGSSDGTGTIADEAAQRYPWITVLHRTRGTERRVGPGVVEAFYAGLESQPWRDYDFVCKLDGDLEFAPEYFEILLNRFAAEPDLGTVSGKCFVPQDGKLVAERTGDEFSHGVAKLYRRDCFEAIGGFVRAVMWDGIDCHRCRMLGWRAESDPDPRLSIVHLRLMGSSHRSVYHGRLRWGRGQYFMGTHPLYLLGITGYRLAERPFILGGLCILLGYFQAALTRQPRYDAPGFRDYLHRWQFQQLRDRLFRFGRGRRTPRVEGSMA